MKNAGFVMMLKQEISWIFGLKEDGEKEKLWKQSK